MQITINIKIELIQHDDVIHIGRNTIQKNKKKKSKNLFNPKPDGREHNP